MNEQMMPDVKLFMMLDNFSIIKSKNKEVRVVRDRINEYFERNIPAPSRLPMLNIMSNNRKNWLY